MYLNLNNEQVFVANGHREFVPTQPTVVFIHGAGMSHLCWALYTRYYAHNGFNVLTIDFPAHGFSTGEPLTTIESMADFVNAVLDHYAVKDCRLVGHSMGSLVAIEAAYRNQERVKHLALIGCAYPMAVGQALLDAAQNNDPSAIDMMVIWGHDYLEQIGGNRVPGVRVITLAKRWLQQVGPGVLYNDLNACNEYQNAETAMSQMNIPVTMIVGDRDKMTPPKVAASVAKTLPHVNYHSIANCGHGCMVEQPEMTHKALAAIVKA
jgi:pimeloyl-ACP methyl ester carboxylesterase